MNTTYDNNFINTTIKLTMDEMLTVTLQSRNSEDQKLIKLLAKELQELQNLVKTLNKLKVIKETLHEEKDEPATKKKSFRTMS